MLTSKLNAFNGWALSNDQANPPCIILNRAGKKCMHSTYRIWDVEMTSKGNLTCVFEGSYGTSCKLQEP
ncbi:hypothetical protein VNO77_34699 [Canavalia gladiata]|uniref:Uncharacterized protein n=1 Tax=Canavalia gladiata TaxID=3824 RepID=A0AAN9KGI8_CANGL